MLAGPVLVPFSHFHNPSYHIVLFYCRVFQRTTSVTLERNSNEYGTQTCESTPATFGSHIRCYFVLFALNNKQLQDTIIKQNKTIRYCNSDCEMAQAPARHNTSLAPSLKKLLSTSTAWLWVSASWRPSFMTYFMCGATKSAMKRQRELITDP